jgi:two-component system, chemotaxis family, chemotaxis protein CheY
VSVLTRQSRTFDISALSVLVIDDQQFFRTLLVEVLRSLGVTRISVAVDGLAGLAAFEEHRPDVVITDWMMPNMDGVALTKKIRSHPIEARKQVPIILVTSNSQRSKIEFARTCGIDEFILKPISAKSIVDRMREVIERPRPFLTLQTYSGPCRRRREEPGFLGPYRRFDDPIEIEDGSDALDQGMTSVMLATLAHVEKLAAALGKGAANVRPVHMAAIEMQGLAEDMGDTHLEQACELLLSCIVVMNTTRKVIPAIIQAHLDAVEQLLKLAVSKTAERDEIVLGLKRMVRRPNAA